MSFFWDGSIVYYIGAFNDVVAANVYKRIRKMDLSKGLEPVQRYMDHNEDG